MPSTLRPAQAPWLHECEIIAIERRLFFDEVAVTVVGDYNVAEAFFSHLKTPSFPGTPHFAPVFKFSITYFEIEYQYTCKGARKL
jgi:hypothetical protein